MGTFPASAGLYTNVPHVPCEVKLKTKDGRTVRIQETSLYESVEMWYRYCDPQTLGFDMCTGTGVSMLAMLHLGMQGIVNDRDGKAIRLGEARARCYMDHLYKENKFQYPELGLAHHTAHDGTDLNAWVPIALGFTAKQASRAHPGSRVLTFPPNNVPYNLKDNMDEEDFEQVRLAVVVSMCTILRWVCVCVWTSIWGPVAWSW